MSPNAMQSSLARTSNNNLAEVVTSKIWNRHMFHLWQFQILDELYV